MYKTLGFTRAIKKKPLFLPPWLMMESRARGGKKQEYEGEPLPDIVLSHWPFPTRMRNRTYIMMFFPTLRFIDHSPTKCFSWEKMFL